VTGGLRHRFLDLGRVKLEASRENEMRAHVLRELCGGLWHATHPDRFKEILTSGAILPDPNIPESDRWGTSQGPDNYPYVRTLGGVSLFDFGGFDPHAYSEKCPMSSWTEFVPYRRHWGCSVWIQIDRERVEPGRLISAPELVRRWHAASAYKHKIMPYIEAAHLGPLPRVAFKRAFLVRKADTKLYPLTW